MAGAETSFDDLPLGPETVAALAAEGIERPTAFQAAAIPVIARGHDLIGRAGPGSGAMVAYGAALVDRLEGGAGAPACVVLCSGSRQATELARSFARICEGAGHRVAALAESWRRPETADFLFVPAERFKALYDGSVETGGVEAVVFHDGDGVVAAVPADRLEVFLASLPKECQRVFCGLPFGRELTSLARRFARRAATVPSARAAPPAPSDRELHLAVLEGSRAESALAVAVRLLEDDSARHVLVFAESADQAADLGDFLTLHGYAGGAPGDEAAPVWLSPGEDAEAAAALAAAPEPRAVATLSAAPPPSAAAAAVRHSEGGPAWTLASVRQLGHLKEVAAGAGLRLRRARPARPRRVSAALDELADAVHEAARAPEAAAYYLLVESLADRFSGAEVAAAALLLLDRERSQRPAPAGRKSDAAGAPPSWVRLFLSAGERDGLGPGEILGAVAGESGVDGKRIGRIDVRESHSLVEVRQEDAKNVISALNGTTLGGRALRVDYDRGKDHRRGGPQRPGPTGERAGAGRRFAAKGAKGPKGRNGPGRPRGPGRSQGSGRPPGPGHPPGSGRSQGPGRPQGRPKRPSGGFRGKPSGGRDER